MPLRVRSLVGLLPLIAVEVLDERGDRPAAGVQASGMRWFLENRPRPRRRGVYARRRGGGGRVLLAIPSRERLVRVLALHARRERVPLAARHPLAVEGARRRIPTASTSAGRTLARRLRAGRVDDRPLRRQLELARARLVARSTTCSSRRCERYHHFYGDDLRVECPTGSGQRHDARRGRARAVARAWPGIFLPDADGRRACHGERRALRRPIRTGATWCSSTSTSTARPAAASAPATRPAGPRWCIRFIEDLARARGAGA